MDHRRHDSRSHHAQGVILDDQPLPADGNALRIAYFVHDISDAGVAKRVGMLKAAGAEVVVLGFHREGRTVSAIDGATVIDLGATYDARLMGRAFKVARRCLSLGTAAQYVKTADVFVARNLEMLAIAAATSAKHAKQAALVYECLDIHRLMFSDRMAGRFLRLIERVLLAKTKLLMLSSPGFVSGYFEPRQRLNRDTSLPTLIVENKLFAPQDRHMASAAARNLGGGPPWRIGWFGTVRCRRSLEILSELARRNRGLIEVVIAGRPPWVEFGDFASRVEHCPGITYLGAYDSSELGKLYSTVHFAWAIDYFEEGTNSSLLLPNRIYEGGAHGAVPIALAGTQTGRWLDERGLGVRLCSPAHELPQFFHQLRPSAYDALKQAIQSAPRELFIADERDCRRLLRALTTASSCHQEECRSGRPVNST